MVNEYRDLTRDEQGHLQQYYNRCFTRYKIMVDDSKRPGLGFIGFFTVAAAKIAQPFVWLIKKVKS